MTAIQIFAILQLLLAFGVSQPTIDRVQVILNKTDVVQTVPTEGVGGVGMPVTVPQDCTPSLEASATEYQGGFMFNATSTYAVGCDINRSTTVTFDTSLVKYRGTIGSWVEGSQGKVIGNQFVYHQGFGLENKRPVNLFWAVGEQVTRVTL